MNGCSDASPLTRVRVRGRRPRRRTSFRRDPRTRGSCRREDPDHVGRLVTPERVRKLAKHVAHRRPAAIRPPEDPGARVPGVRVQDPCGGDVPAIRVGRIDGDRHHVAAIEARTHGLPREGCVHAPGGTEAGSFVGPAVREHERVAITREASSQRSRPRPRRSSRGRGMPARRGHDGGLRTPV